LVPSLSSAWILQGNFQTQAHIQQVPSLILKKTETKTKQKLQKKKQKKKKKKKKKEKKKKKKKKKEKERKKERVKNSIHQVLIAQIAGITLSSGYITTQWIKCVSLNSFYPPGSDLCTG